MYCKSFGKTAPCHQTPKPLTRSVDAGDQQQDSGSTNYVHQARRLRRRRPPPCQASRARKCPGVCGRAAASMPPVNETHPNAKKPDTRGLPPTARLITPHSSPIANNTHTRHTGHRRAGHGSARVCAAGTPPQRKNATKRNRSQHPWAAAHGSPIRTHATSGHLRRAGHGSARVPRQGRRHNAKTPQNAINR